MGLNIHQIKQVVQLVLDWYCYINQIKMYVI